MSWARWCNCIPKRPKRCCCCYYYFCCYCYCWCLCCCVHEYGAYTYSWSLYVPVSNVPVRADYLFWWLLCDQDGCCYYCCCCCCCYCDRGKRIITPLRTCGRRSSSSYSSSRVILLGCTISPTFVTLLMLLSLVDVDVAVAAAICFFVS